MKREGSRKGKGTEGLAVTLRCLMSTQQAVGLKWRTRRSDPPPGRARKGKAGGRDPRERAGGLSGPEELLTN